MRETVDTADFLYVRLLEDPLDSSKQNLSHMAVTFLIATPRHFSRRCEWGRKHASHGAAGNDTQRQRTADTAS